MAARHRVSLAALLTLVVAVAAAARLQISYDLSAFLPPADSFAQKLLTQRLGESPGAQLIFIELKASNRADAAALADQLRQHPLVRRVLPETLVFSPGSVPNVLWQNRLLLGELPEDSDTWFDVLNERMDDLAFAADEDMLNLIAADPALLSVRALERFTAGASQPAFDQGSTQYLMVETASAGFELTAQTELVHDLRRALSSQPGATVIGSPVYAVDLQNSVRYEATLFSSLAGLALLLLMIARFRSVQRVIGVALPLAAGGVFGLLTLTLAFEEVHGITLAFGFTLLGVAIDYPLHLFIHADREADTGGSAVWPILRLGILSTLTAYGAFMFSGTQGLQQLGVFAFAGVAAAAFTAAWITATSPTDAITSSPVSLSEQQNLRWWPAVTALAFSATLLYDVPTFNDDLSSLTPVDPEVLAADAALRQQLGVTDMRYLVSVRAADREAVLRSTERALLELSSLQESGKLAGVQSITHILPSRHTQDRRYESLRAMSPDVFEEVLEQTGLQPGAFAPFLEAIQHQRQSQTYITLEQLKEDTSIGGAVDNLLFFDGGDWVSLMFLRRLEDPQGAAALFATSADVELVDLKHTSESLVTNYRTQLISILLLALFLIAVLLSLRQTLRKSAWLVLNVLAAVGCAAACSAVWHNGLSLFDLIALTLVAGLGLDYVLFYSRDRSGGDDRATAEAVLICAISSLLVFGILSLSSIPVLQGIGTTVSAGVAAAYVLARFGRYANTGS